MISALCYFVLNVLPECPDSVPCIFLRQCRSTEVYGVCGELELLDFSLSIALPSPCIH